jgi:chromosome condensin MukBEF MukE localization factor
MKNVTSIFTQHYNDLMQISDAQELEQRIQTIVNESKINEFDQRKVLNDVRKVNNNLLKLQMYLTNSMLKYQGLGTIK